MNQPFIPILGTNVSTTTYEDTLTAVNSWIVQKKRVFICVAAVHLIMECYDNKKLRAGVNQAGLATPDGMPLVWLSKLSGEKHVERVYGPTLMLKLCSLAQTNNWKIFLLGGTLGQGQLLAQRLKQQFPRLTLTGFKDTPHKQFGEKENSLIVRQINRLRPQLVFVGLGCPFQELWMIQNRKALNANVLIGVGAAFDFLTDKEKQAPRFIQSVGLEWLFRLIQNPQRLWYRYLVLNTSFIAAVIAQALARRIPFLR